MQNSTFEVFKKDEKRVSGKCGGILFVLKLILGLFPVLQRRGAFLALFACSFLPLYADEFVVSTLADDGNEGSFRSGIIAANGSSAIDTITFAQGVSGTITLTSDLPAITENLTITGPSGSESVTISGNDQYAMFSVSGKTLTLSDLTFTEIKSVSGENGSIITLASANAVATGITVTGNTNGTAFFSKQSTLTISDSTFSDNSGLIFGSDHGSSPNQSSVPSGDLPEPGQNRITVTDSLFKLNSGTIFSTQRYVKIDGCVFSENSGMIGSFSGLSPYQVLDSEFNGNTNSLLFAFYTPHLDTHGGFFNGNHHLFDGNTFSGNTGNLINVGNTPRFGEITTISNNTFEGSGGSYTTYITGATPIYLNNVETPLIGPGADLTNANLSGVDLSGADLSGADLTGVTLIGAYLTGADLTNAYLSGAYLDGADLSGAILTNADLSGAILTEADLTNANLNEGANLTYAILTGAYLTGANLTGADLTNAYLSDANLTNANLTNADLTNADLTNAYLSGANLSGADLSGADLSGADLSGADLSGAILDWADLIGAYLTGADLTNANLTNAYLSWAELDGADLSGANLTNADLSNANLKEGANLTNAILAYADLTGANLTGANLTGANLTGAYLTDANLTNANLTNADLTMAIVNDFTLISSPSGWTIENGMMVATTVKNAYAIQIDANTNIALDSTVGGVGGLWSWYSNGVASDPSNSLSVFLASVRNATMHRMSHSAFDPGSLSQTSGSTTYDYNYTGIPGSGNNDSTKGVVLKYTATEEREILIETTGGAWNDAVIVIFTEAHLNGGSAPFRVVTADAGDPETFKVKFPYFTDNQDGNIYYIALTSNRSSDLASDTPLRITASDITAPVITSGTTGTDLAENSGAGQTVYTIAASDANGVVSYAIGGTDAASLTVNPTIGVVTLNTNPDYEAKNSYSFTVTASDAAGNTSDPTTVTFQITDIDEIPLVIEPGANLAGADLSGADLYGANLSGADLSNANLSDANLYGAALSDANLNGANLNNASLYGANLSNANLAGADLSGANLYGALLSNANLSNANLNGANLYGAVLSDANLTNATVNDVTEISLPGRWIIENNMIVEVEVEPVLVSELPDITATEDGPDVLIDLGPFFKDDNSADDAAMSYAVTENTNGAMVTTSVNTDVFVLKGSYRNGGGYAGEVVVDGNYAYVADGQQGLTVVNVSDPESPTLAGNYDPGWDIGDVAISGGYAYLANQSGGVRVVSIADPSNPTEVAQYITAGSARGIDVSGNYAYVADGSGLVILDVSNPSAPVLVGTSNTPDFAYRVDVEGGHAYVADRAGGLQIVDISDPSSPQIVGSYSTQAGSNWSTGAAWGVKVEGGYAYMAASGAGLIIVDVSNPANPVLEGSYSTNVGDARGVYVLSGKAYLADGSSGSSGLLVIDVTSPSSPVLVGTYDSMGSGMGVTAVGDYAYLADWGGGLKIVDTTYITDELALSFEPDASGSADITVTATSGADTVSDTFNVTIANVNDAPQFNNGSGGPFGDEWQFTIGEDASVDAVVGTVTATDVDGDTLDYSITDGNEFGLFTIDPSSGEIKVWGVLDYETATYHSLKVQVADTALSATTWVRVDVSNVPEITLAGDAVVTIEVGGSYTEDSATSDGGETVAATGTVNTNTVDTYTITYSATDNFNNTGTAIRTVNVVDITKPVISLTGDAVVTIEAGTPYQDQGVTVSDNYDTNLTVTIDSSDVNTSVLGSYEVIYSATDGSGNVADEETRTVIVEDNTAPVITLIGDAQVTIEMGGTYTEQGATFLDNHDTELTTTIEDDVDTAVVGSYEVIYSATDDFENQETATRTVIVEDTTAPDAPTLNGPALTKSTTPTLIGTAEPGSIVRIYHDGSELGSATAESGSYSITVSSLSSLSEGSHIITATATDAFNNVSAGTTHEVEVDTTAPVISVTPGNDIGAANITVTAPMIIWTAGEPHAQINFNSSSTADQTALASALGFESFDQTEIINYMFNNDIEMTVLHDDGNSFTFKIVPGQYQSFADGYVYLDPRPVTSLLQGDFEITVKLSSPMVEAGAPYSDAGATADGEESVVTTGTVDTSVLGPHTLTYTAEDLAGNVGTATRTVTVVDTTLPEITLIGGEVTIEVDGSYTELGATLLDNYDSSSSLGSSDLYVIDSSAVNTSVVGEYTVTYNVTDSEDNVAQQVTRTVNVVDTTLPEITLNGGDVTIEVGAPYEEPGATVSDNYDTDLNAEIDSDAVNTSDVGSYSVTYNVTDSNSNDAQQVTRTVNVVDTTLPEITLNGGGLGGAVTIPLGGSYTEFGATVSDNYDQELAVTIDSSAVDTSVVDSYSVTYNVTDDSNNTRTVTRTVNVVDITLPVVTLNGGHVTIEMGSTYTELGATASDNYYTTGLIFTTTGEVDTSAVGTYEITYSATDGSGNKGTAKRTVTVEDTTAPVVTVTPGNDAVVMGASWSDAGATSDGGETVEVTGTVDTSAVGPYTIIYSATDASGNKGTATRTVIVRNSLDSFGDVVVYQNNSTTLIGQVTIEGEAAESGDVVAVYVGDELRGKQEVIIFDGTAWVNMIVNRSGEVGETISFKVFDSSTGLTHEKTKASEVITSSDAKAVDVGSFADPVMIEMKDFEIQSLSLKKGWNLVSFYVEADDMSPQAFLAPIQNELLQIKNLGYAYIPSVGSQWHTLTNLSVKEGYWVEVSEDVSFEVEGRVSSGVSTYLNNGWNLVGYPRMNGEAVASELATLGETVVQMKTLEDSYDPSNPSFLNTLSTMTPGLGYWLKVTKDDEEDLIWELGDGGPSFANFKTRSNHSSEQKVGPVWSDPVVYPNLGATVLAEVSIQGKPVAMGSVVGVFVGNELRGQQNVVLHEGSSYVTLNVNLNEAEEVSYRVWNRDDNNEYLVSGTMLLELGARYGNPELVELNAVEVVEKPLQVFNVTSEPFGFSFNTMAGRDYTVEATGDLRTWEAVESFQGSGGEIRFTPRPTSSGKRQFFRVYVK